MEDKFLREKLEAMIPVPGMCAKCGLFPKVKPKHSCVWCGLAKETADVQARAALARQAAAPAESPRTRPKSEWPPNMRWCGSCRSYVALSYTSGTVCKGCAVVKRRSASFGLTPEEQRVLMTLQDNRCAICTANQQGRALSVDHRHMDDLVRGILCGKGGYSCNEVIGFWFDDAARFVATACYLLDPPYQKVQGKELSNQELEAHIINLVREYRFRLGYRT